MYNKLYFIFILTAMEIKMSNNINKGKYRCKNGMYFEVVGVAEAPEFNTVVVIISKQGKLEIDTVKSFKEGLNNEYEFVGFD